MKLTMLKTLLFALYFTTLAIVWQTPGLFDGFSLLVVTFFLGYCGIIVLSQLGSVLAAWFAWCVAFKQERRADEYTSPAVSFETESEAT